MSQQNYLPMFMKSPIKTVIDCARLALHRLAMTANYEGFENVASIISATKGKVVTIGMGKSYFLAEKFAGTLSSLGIPAFALNAANLGHGDYGAIDDKDVIVAFSKSGGTKELLTLGSHPTSKVLITENRVDLLAQCFDFVLVLPACEEAGRLSAPTTSFTVFGVVGDAIAIRAAHIRGLSDKDLKITHQSGNIGVMLSGKE